MLEGPNIIRSTAGEASWTPITDDGRGGASEPVDLSQDDKDDDIVVELHTDVGQVAKAVVKIADIWAVGALSQRPAHWNIGSAIVRLARRHEMSRRGTCIFACWIIDALLLERRPGIGIVRGCAGQCNR